MKSKSLQRSSVIQRIERILEIIQKTIVAGIGFIIVSLISMLIIWIIMLVIKPQQPHFKSIPNLQIKSNNPQSLQAIYTNLQNKNLICLDRQNLINTQQTFKKIGLTISQYCNINYQYFPTIKSDVDIYINGLNSQYVEYVDGCLLTSNEDNHLACQKYRPTSNLLMFKQISLSKLSYFSLEIHFKDNQIHQETTPQVLFIQKIGIIQEILRKYYFILSICLSVGLGLTCGVAYLLWEISNNIKQNQINKIHYL